MTAIAAILTGDLIASTVAVPGQVDRAMRLIMQTADRIGPQTRFTRNRGDGWQIYLEKPGQGLWMAVLLLAVLKADANGLSSRIAIGLGAAHGLRPTDLAAAGGGGFVASGRALDKMVSGQILALAGDGTDDLHRCLVAFVEDQVKAWSREQAEAVALALQRPGMMTQGEIATALSITRQAVGARLQAAKFGLVRKACESFRDHFRAEGQPHD